MPEEHMYTQQRYDLNELESAAVQAVTEIEEICEVFTGVTGVDVTVHSPEANWSDPVRLTEVFAKGGVMVSVEYGEARSGVVLPEDDAALITALLGGVPNGEVTKVVKKGFDPNRAEMLVSLFDQVFVARGGRTREPVYLESRQDNIPLIEEAMGASFLGVKVAVTIEGYSDGHMYRVYDSRYVEEHFRTEAASMSLDTQVLPSTSGLKALKVEEIGEPAGVPGDVEGKAGGGEDAIRKLRRIPVMLRVHLASRTMKFRDVLKLLPGEVVEFDRKVSEPCEVMVNSHVIAGGEVVKSGPRYGIKLRKIASVRQRLKSL
ncbi:MAG: FliM/FliN family flagellar motor switch protein [Planctomycetes bacterium]|nr:FliM/FliN family flagellar motor switch protein [Planctomycetota bacterium]